MQRTQHLESLGVLESSDDDSRRDADLRGSYPTTAAMVRGALPSRRLLMKR